MTLSDSVQGFLRSHGLRLNTDLGQHFLIDEDVLAAIVEAANIQTADHIVEIGPGIGVLTRELLAHAGHVTAIELDARLIPLLEEFVADTSLESTTAGTTHNHNQTMKIEKHESKPGMPALKENHQTKNEKRKNPSTPLRAGGPTNKRINVINGNALHTPFPTENYKVVANIPYHITSPLLRHAFLESPHAPTSMTLLIQREVAEKICDTEQAGMLTIIVALFGEPHIVCAVPPSSFLPPPEVDSAVLHIDCLAKPLADRPTIETVLKLTKLAFGQKRKMLRNSIGKLPDGMLLLDKADINPERRPETLDIGEWIALAGVLRTHGTGNSAD